MDQQVITNKVWTTCLCILATLAMAFILIYAKSILIPFVLASFISFVVSPLIAVMQTRLKFPKVLAVAATGFLVVGGVALIFVLISSSVKGAFSNVDAYKSSIIVFAAKLVDWLEVLGIPDEMIAKESLLESLRELPVFSYFQRAAGTMFSAVSNTMLVVLFVMFLLTGDSVAMPKSETIREISAKIRTYLLTKLLTSTITGVLVTIVLAIIGVDMALMFGFLSFLLNFIPTIGSLIATLLPVPIAMIKFGISWQTITALALPGAIQFAIGNVIEPKLMGDSLDLHPVSILLCLMFWGLMWGIPGMILATPILVILKISLSRSGSSQVLSELLSGRVSTGSH